jgi:hypothetical protein
MYRRSHRLPRVRCVPPTGPEDIHHLGDSKHRITAPTTICAESLQKREEDKCRAFVLLFSGDVHRREHEGLIDACRPAPASRLSHRTDLIHEAINLLLVGRRRPTPGAR